MLRTFEQPGCFRISANARTCKSCIESSVLVISGRSTFRNPHPASARQSNAAKNFLNISQLDQPGFVLGWDAMHQAFGAIS
jgi:hypothetical protein